MDNTTERTILHNMREAIARPHVKVVSFDVFDTLLVRPVVKPTDLFFIVEERVREDENLPNIPFMDIRPWAEKEARAWIGKASPHYEDITLDEIYDVIADRCNLSPEICKRIKQIEIDIELRYLSARKTLKPIYDYAISLGKRVVVVSDVYLPVSVLIEALQRNGYDRIERYFVSSELRVSKGRGGVYPRILYDLDIAPQEIVHIGDNAKADFLQAKKHKFEAFHFPKISEIMETGRTNWSIWQNRIEHAEPAYRLVHGMIQNEFFDTLPREGYSKDSLFNGNPYLLGYYGVGPFILSLTQWLIREASARGDEVIGFIARDGWLPKLAYDLLRPYYPKAPDSVYFRISRSVCYPFDVENISQLMFSEKLLHFERSLPARQVVESRLFRQIDKDFAQHFIENGINLDDKCSDFQNLMRVACSYGENSLDGLVEHRDNATEYYQNLFKNYEKISVFDCGYSGRAQRVLSKILQTKPFGYYIFSFDTISALDRERLLYANFLGQPINRRLEQEPIVTAILELLISEFSNGSITGFTRKNGNVEPLIEKEKYDTKAIRTLNSIQIGCLDFIRVAISIFGSDIRYLNITHSTASRALRHFMLAPHATDAAIFNGMQFSNGITGENRKIIGESEIRSKWKEGYNALHNKSPVSNPQDSLAPQPKPESPLVQKVGSKIVYKGRELPARISDMRVLPAVDFLDGVALFAAERPSQELKEKCRNIIRTKSKWLGAAVLLKETGGVWRSKIDLRDKIRAQRHLFAYNGANQ